MLQMNVLKMTKHLKKSCLLECKQSAAKHQVKQELMHMHRLRKSSRTTFKWVIVLEGLWETCIKGGGSQKW